MTLRLTARIVAIIVLLNPGTYEVKVVPTSGAPVTKTVTFEAEKTVIVK